MANRRAEDHNEKEAEAAFVIDREGCLAGAAVYSSEAGGWLDFRGQGQR